MRALLMLLLLLPALASAKEVYKWVDDKGVIHYTDKPPSENAKPAKLPPLQTYKGGTKPNLSKYEKPGKAGPAASAQVQVVTPSNEETFRSGERVVPVAVMVTPQLSEGQRLIYLYDGAPQAQPTTDTSFALTNVDRGTHTVSVTVVDEDGNEIGASNAVTFYMKPPTVNPPAGQQQNSQNPGPPNPARPNPKPQPKKP